LADNEGTNDPEKDNEHSDIVGDLAVAASFLWSTAALWMRSQQLTCCGARAFLVAQNVPLCAGKSLYSRAACSNWNDQTGGSERANKGVGSYATESP